MFPTSYSPTSRRSNAFAAPPQARPPEANACATKKATQPPEHSLFCKLHKKSGSGVIVDVPSFDADLHIETTTIMFADVVESVRLIEQDESRNVVRIRSLLKFLATSIALKHGGIVLERRGDGLLIKFPNDRSAAACAPEFHAQAAIANSGFDASDVIALRVGIHKAEVIADEGAVYGRGINVAARVASLAGPGETVASAAVRDQLTHGVDASFRDMGACFVKNVAEPVRAYQLSAVNNTAPEPLEQPLPDLSGSDHCVALAVLPMLRDEGADSELCGTDVFVDQLIDALSQSASLRVISRLSSNAFRRRGTADMDAGKMLRAHYVLGGTCIESSGYMSAHLELTHCNSGQVVWEEAFQFKSIDALNSNSDAVRKAAARVMESLTQTELQVAHGRPLPNLAAHTLYLAAVTFLHRFSHVDFDRARLMLEALRERAPRNASPAAWLARWHVFRIVQGWSTDVKRDGALAHDFSQRALDHDPRSSLALAMAGSVEAGVNRDLTAARNYYDLALASNPNEPLAWLLKSVAHGFMGEADAALQSSQRSLQLSPLDPLRFYYDSLSSAAAMGANQYGRAVELAQRAIHANCMHGSAYRTLAIAQVTLNDVSAAQTTVRRLLAIEPQSTVQQFLARAAAQSAQNDLFAKALETAGLPWSSSVRVF
jgi:adenylate cyclase